jgi:sugar phosphate isomerase/epimerase
MKRRHMLQSLFCLLMLASAPFSKAGTAEPWPFFAFDNGVGRGVWPASKQAETVKSLGYDGIHYNYTNPKDFATKIAACKAANVPIKAMYFYTFVDKPGAAYDPGVKDAIRMLKGSDTVIWMTLRDGKRGQQDQEAAQVVREIAGMAAESGLKVSIYPHAGFYVATAEDAVRVVKRVDLPNVGVTINLCHELFAGNSERLAEVVKTAAPYLNLVSINGASPIPGQGAESLGHPASRIRHLRHRRLPPPHPRQRLPRPGRPSVLRGRGGRHAEADARHRSVEENEARGSEPGDPSRVALKIFRS